MEENEIVKFITSKEGIFAAVISVVGFFGVILGIVRPYFKRRREIKSSIPDLKISNIQIKDPPPWSEAGELAFNLVNSGGGKAVMTNMWLYVVDHGQLEKKKSIEIAAPVPQYNFKVMLSPDTQKYDVRAKKFGPKPQPHSFNKDEVEAYLIEMTSSEPQWYRFRLEIDWYMTSDTNQKNNLKSEELYIEFLPE